MHCQEYEALERDFIDVRCRHRLESFEAFKQGIPEAEHRKLIANQAKEELHALNALLDHAAEHGCQRSSPH